MRNLNNDIVDTMEQMEEGMYKAPRDIVSDKRDLKLSKVLDIKNIKQNEFRLFYIVDTATKEKIGHADICAIRSSDIALPKKALKQYIRYEISLVFNNFVKIVA